MMSKKYIVTIALVLGIAFNAVAQPVMVERQGRAEHIKSYYAPDKGFIIDFNLGYALSLNGFKDYASQTPSPSIGISAGYAFSDKWKVYLSYQSITYQEDKGSVRIPINDYTAITGEGIHNIDINNIMIGGEYGFPVSQYVKPYVGVSVGVGSVKMTTEISDQYSFEDSKWVPVIAPEAGLRGFFDKKLTVGYKASVSYNQYFGSIETIDAKISSPSCLRIGLGVFVKIL
ncbi:MAG: outer membrane beta-barrel protein [Flavobacteriales bacterium]|nr:outer membrane beta-barrel protein [Flavobacteriales bacterium]